MEEGLDAIAGDFDYFETELDEQPDSTLEFVFTDPLQRARAILRGRTYSELDYGLESLDWLLRQGGRRFWAEINHGQHGDSVIVNRPKALRALVPVVDLGDQTGFPEATWPEYFALLALACVGEQLYVAGCSWGDIYGRELAKGLDLDAMQTRHQQILWGSAMEALEAVCYAEHYLEIDRLEQLLSEAERQRIEAQRERGRQGKEAVMRPYDQLRQRLLAHYDAELSGRSDRGAAARLYQLFQDEVDAVLTTDDPRHQIAKWIGRHRRSQAPAQAQASD